MTCRLPLVALLSSFALLGAITSSGAFPLATPASTADRRVRPAAHSPATSSVRDLPLTPIPEVDPSIPAIVLCVAAAVFAHLRKRRI
jgi:hypothetical protein